MAAALRPSGAIVRPRQHLRPRLPADDRGIPAHDRGSDVLRGHPVRQPRGRRLRSLYFDAFDAWHAGRRLDVPAAWSIAFQAAADRAVNAAGQPLAGHQRPRPARPAVRARRHRAREARRLQPQARPRPREHVPQPRHRRPVRRDRPPLRSDDRRRQPPRHRRRRRRVPAHPDLAGDRLAKRRASRARPRPPARAQVAASIEAYAASQASRSGWPRPTRLVRTAPSATPTARRTTGRRSPGSESRSLRSLFLRPRP